MQEPLADYATRRSLKRVRQKEKRNMLSKLKTKNQRHAMLQRGISASPNAKMNKKREQRSV